jgi:hypothetical protein
MALYWSDAELQAIVTPNHQASCNSGILWSPRRPSAAAQKIITLGLGKLFSDY